MTIELAPGMNAIVGPNGCGKSNVVDALKWAMGDMSPKSLRGQEMQDVIFAGSQTAKPMGLAEVTLTFLNNGELTEEAFGDQIPREFRQLHEIAITRRLHRSGDSEYLINKVPCRLLDIQNLLAGTGLGKQGYSIIEQNQVGFIVSSRPSERRLLIEEASGITRYKGQRDRTVKRLEKAEENLQRVADILAEVEKQIRSLERQAQRAAQYRRFADELRALEVGMLLTRRQHILVQRDRIRAECEVAQHERERAAKAFEAHEATLEAARVDLFAAEKYQGEETEKFYRAETRLNVARSKRDHAVETLSEARRRLETSTREVTLQAERRQRLQHELDQVQGELSGLAAATDAQQDVNNQEDALGEAKRIAQEAQADARRARVAFDQEQAEHLRRDDRAQWLIHQRSELESREAEHALTLSQLTQELQRWRARLDAATTRVAELREIESTAADQVNHDAKAAELAVVAARDARHQYQDAHRDLLNAQTRRDSLAAMAQRAEGFDDGVQMVMDWANRQGRADVLGPLANLVKLPAAHVDAIGRAVGDKLAEILVTSQQAAVDANRGAKPKGRVVFRVVEADFDAQNWVDELVRGLDFAKDLSDVKVSKSVAIWVLDSGELVLNDGRIVVGASVGNVEALVRRQQQLEQLVASMAELEARSSQAEAALSEADDRVTASQAVVEARRRLYEDARVSFATASRELESDRREVERFEKSLERHRSQLVPLLRRKEEIAEELERIASRDAEFEQVRDALQSQLQELDELASRRQQEADRLANVLTERRVELAQTLERRRGLEESRVRLDRSVASTEALIDRYGRESDEARTKIAEIESVLSGGGEDLAELDALVTTSKKTMEAAKERSTEAQNRVREIEAQSREKRERLDVAIARVQASEVAQREADIGLRHVDEQLRDAFGLTPEGAAEVHTSIQIPEEEWASRRDYLKRRIEGLGPVNAMAEDEYKESLERQAFLATQRDDLVRSVSDLKKAIAEMDRESRRRFRDTFEAVNSKFQEIFPKLFRGGQARLLLTDPDDLLATGVDIEVSPPGKRLQNVSLLSGGEKALTAVSLIFSIFLLKPTPFSVLDEVDAPLDEANVGRFAQMVREMSATSQMIVITHSRRTMESAELLYGVTMEQPGVSKIVSVRLSDDDPFESGRVA